MKKLIVIFALITITVLCWKKSISNPEFSLDVPHPFMSSLKAVKHRLTESLAQITQQPNQPVLSSIETPIQVFEKTNDLVRKAILSDSEQLERKSNLSSIANINAATSALKIFGSGKLADDQKRRMEAGLFLLNSLSEKDNPSIEYVRAQVATLILDPSLDGINDIQLKRSVVADRIELLITLKKLFPEEAEHISANASTDLQKKMNQFANEYLNLGKKGT